MAKIPDGVISATLKNLITGKEWQLSTREGSGCHFIERRRYDRFEIGLRFDWTSLDKNNDPILDADFFNPGETKPIKSMNKHPAHHTLKTFDPTKSMWLYRFEFEKLKMELVLTVTKQNELKLDAFLEKSEQR